MGRTTYRVKLKRKSNHFDHSAGTALFYQNEVARGEIPYRPPSALKTALYSPTGYVILHFERVFKRIKKEIVFTYANSIRFITGSPSTYIAKPGGQYRIAVHVEILKCGTGITIKRF